ncbi:MAG: hypothetical protein WD184_02360 [Acidimicrobiia bacterium]
MTLYEALLKAYPPEVRDEYGDDMVQLFTDRYRDGRPGGDMLRFARFWGGIVGDLVWTALTERTESVVANFKQQWWKWAIGLVAALEALLVVLSIARLVTGDDPHGASDPVATLVVSASAMVALVLGLGLLRSRPRLAAGLLVYGLLPAVAAGIVVFWLPPMYLVSLLGVYVSVRVLMEAGRLTRSGVAPA